MLYLILTWIAWPVLALMRRPQPPTVARVLVIQRAKIGDAICATPVFRALRSAFPACRLDVLATPVTAEMLEINPRIDGVLVASDRELAGWRGKIYLVRMLRRERYDTVVCLNAGLIYPVASFWAGIPLRYAVLPNFLGTTYRLASKLWTAVEPHHGDRLIIETYGRLLRRMGVSGFTIDKEVFSTPDAAERVDHLLGNPERPWIGVGISAANKLKELGFDKLRAVLAGLRERHPACGVLLIGSAADHPLAQSLADDFPGTDIVNACGVLALTELPELLRRLVAYLGVDSGITYMADATGTPVVSVAGPCNMQETRPLGEHVVIVQIHPPCSPCAHIFRAPYACAAGDFACIREVSPGRILAAIDHLLEETRLGARKGQAQP